MQKKKGNEAEYNIGVYLPNCSVTMGFYQTGEVFAGLVLVLVLAVFGF